MRKNRFDNTSGGNEGGQGESPEEGKLKVTFTRHLRRGKMHLRSENPNPEDDRWYLLDPWLSLPALGDQLTEATVAVISSEKQTTRTATHRDLRYGFISFLNEVKPNAELKDLCAELFRDFVTWLDAHGPEGKPKRSYFDKLHKLSALKKLVGRLSPTLSELGVDHEIPVNSWSGQHTQRGKGKETIPLEQFVDLLAAAIAAYEEQVKEIDRLLAKVDKKLASLLDTGQPDFHTVEGLCAVIIERYDGMLPEREWLKKKDNKLFEAIEGFGYTGFARIINPQVNDLIPAFIILQCFTHWNEQPLCCLRITDIDKNAGVLHNKYKLSSYKVRAKKMVFRSFAKGDEVFNPCNVVDFIERWTKHMRRSAPERIQQDLFLYVSKFKNRKVGAVRSLAQPLGGLYSLSLDRKLKFFQERGLEPAGANALRQAGSDYLRDLLKDSEKVRILLGHSSVTTTDGNYRSSEAQRRDEVALAGAMAMKERHQDSAGKIDPRGHYEDRSAATPGYDCLDPFQSPVVGQVHGRMCTAYGLCPACPTKVMRLHDVFWARRIQLQQRYKQAALAMGSARFNQRYGPAAEALNTSLMRLTDSDLARIGRLNLNPIPELE